MKMRLAGGGGAGQKSVATVVAAGGFWKAPRWPWTYDEVHAIDIALGAAKQACGLRF